MYRRSLRFAVNCINTDCSVVHDVVKMNLLTRPAQSVVGRTLLHCCNLYCLHLSDLIAMSVNSVKVFTDRFNFGQLSRMHSAVMPNEHLNLLMDCIFIRDGVFNIFPEPDSYSDLQDIMRDIILLICTT